MTELLPTPVAKTPIPAPPPDTAQPALTGATSAPSGAARRPGPRSVSCVLPCFNEAENLAGLLPLLVATLAGCASAWEVIVVDDGSTDGTAALLSAWTRRPGLRALLLSRNFGKEAALSAGLEAARGDVVVLMDADLQHQPALIPAFIDRWAAGADVVYAVREDRRDETRFKRWGTRAFYALVNAAARFQVPAGAGDFRLLDRSVVEALLRLPERNRFMKGLYAWVGFDAVAVPYVPAPRGHGSSHFRPLRLIRLSLDGLTAFTTWPLRAVSALGCVLALLAFGYGGYLSVDYIANGHAVSGWTTIVVSLMLLSGLQLISLGVVGEYIGRVFEEVKARPLYVVKREFGRGLAAPGPQQP